MSLPSTVGAPSLGLRLGGGCLMLVACLVVLMSATSARAQAQGGGAASARLGKPSPPPTLIGTETRDCRHWVEVPGANDGSLMKVYVFGKPAPSCRAGARRMRAAVARLPIETWGRVGRWRCVWYTAEVYCGRDGVRVYATNPGD